MIYINYFILEPPLKKNQDPHQFVNYVIQKHMYSLTSHFLSERRKRLLYHLNALFELDKRHDNETSIVCSLHV